MNCTSCGAGVDLTTSSCPACGAQVELGRLTGILGVVCRACDAYNEPGAGTCAACGKPLRAGAQPSAPPSAAPAPPAPRADSAAPPPSAAPLPPAPRADSAAPPPPPPQAPVVRSFQRPATGAATRFVPSLLRPTGGVSRPKAGAERAPVPPVSTCPRCGSETGRGRFCVGCGQALGARGVEVTTRPPARERARTLMFAAPPGRATLVLEGGGEALGGATFALDEERVEAGRTKGSILFPDDPCLAPHHATFLQAGGAVRVRDEGAPGGIYLRLRGPSAPLRAGDHFAVGERLLRYAGLLPSPPPPPPDGTARLGSPRPPPPGVVVEEWLEGGTAGRVFVRSGPSVTIGRGGAAVSLGDDPQVSEDHAEIVVERDGTARLRDLGSSSGTYVRLPPHGERELRDGDLVRLGREVLRVEIAE